MKNMLGVAIATILISTHAMAAGAPPYPNAKVDAEVAAALKKSMSLDADAYRTADSVEKVADYYRKQGLKELPGTSKEGAAFSMKSGTMMTIQNPWMDMKTGKMNHDTLVVIPKK